jgi:hypothetical protein
MEILEPKASGTLWATPGLLRDPFTFTYWYNRPKSQVFCVKSTNGDSFHYVIFPILSVSLSDSYYPVLHVPPRYNKVIRIPVQCVILKSASFKYHMTNKHVLTDEEGRK